ncbi:MAG TPA: pyridoxamine 5'-phosphate oxidase family protein [Gemmatimonadaceae bacterium]|nr:pyridoxamine 5'-phosphate oxidase family protein [Gemmatimonadaceae bacterium]
MATFYHDGNRSLQDRFDTRRLADRLEQATVHDEFDAHDVAFIESLDMFFLATVNQHGHANCSYKGGEPGFVRVIDERTLAFPNYDGNGMYMSMGNVVATAQVGMLFIDFQHQFRMRVNGEASIEANDPLMARYPEAQFVVRVRAREIFPNCPRYIHKYKLVARSRFVPNQACDTPVPSWKKGDWVSDVLPKKDVARGDDREVLDR